MACWKADPMAASMVDLTACCSAVHSVSMTVGLMAVQSADSMAFRSAGLMV